MNKISRTKIKKIAFNFLLLSCLISTTFADILNNSDSQTINSSGSTTISNVTVTDAISTGNSNIIKTIIEQANKIVATITINAAAFVKTLNDLLHTTSVTAATGSQLSTNSSNAHNSVNETINNVSKDFFNASLLMSPPENTKLFIEQGTNSALIAADAYNKQVEINTINKIRTSISGSDSSSQYDLSTINNYKPSSLFPNLDNININYNIDLSSSDLEIQNSLLKSVATQKSTFSTSSIINDDKFNLSSLLKPTSYSDEDGSLDKAQFFIREINNSIVLPSPIPPNFPLHFTAKQIDNLVQQYKASITSNNSTIDIFTLTRGLQQSYVNRVTKMFFFKNITLDNIFALYADRLPQEEIKKLNMQDLSGKNITSNLQLQEYLAKRRLDKKYIERIEQAPSAEIQREILYTLAEIRKQQFDNHLVMERILAGLTMIQINQMEVYQKDLDQQRTKIEGTIKNILDGNLSNINDLSGKPSSSQLMNIANTK